MIARGDLAAEIDFVRTADMQEDILWIAGAAQVPVIRATPVLEAVAQLDGLLARMAEHQRKTTPQLRRPASW
jgi:pyruvate kinase